MRVTTLHFRIARLLSLVLMIAGGSAGTRAELIRIEIKGGGARAKYIKVGDTDQQPVEVVLGDKVEWINRGNTTHTATAELKGPNGKPLFDTDSLRAGQTSSEILFDKKIFELAGGEPGQAVQLEYLCDFHGRMKSLIVLRERRPDKAKVERTCTIRYRKNIDRLTASEIDTLRRGFAHAMSSGILERYVRIHRANMYPAHQTNYFLPWHRAFLYYFEEDVREDVPGFTLPYWHYDHPTMDPFRFLPEILRPATAGGSPNPLHRSRFRGWNTGSRSFRYSDVRSDGDLGIPGYADFRSALEFGSHAHVHNNLSSVMSNTAISPRDPAFWFHHSNVDRIWEVWINRYSYDPSPSWKSRTLPGFETRPRRTIGDFLDLEELCYEYVMSTREVRFGFDEKQRLFFSQEITAPRDGARQTGPTLIRLENIRVPKDANLMGTLYFVPNTSNGVPEYENKIRLGTFVVLGGHHGGKNGVTVVKEVSDELNAALKKHPGQTFRLSVDNQFTEPFPETEHGVKKLLDYAPSRGVLSFPTN